MKDCSRPPAFEVSETSSRSLHTKVAIQAMSPYEAVLHLFIRVGRLS